MSYASSSECQVTLTNFRFNRSEHYDLVSWSIVEEEGSSDGHGIDHFVISDGLTVLHTNPERITPANTGETGNILLWGLESQEGGPSYLVLKGIGPTGNLVTQFTMAVHTVNSRTTVLAAFAPFSLAAPTTLTSISAGTESDHKQLASAVTEPDGATAEIDEAIGRKQLLLSNNDDLQNRLGRTYCDEAQLLTLLLTHGFVRELGQKGETHSRPRKSPRHAAQMLLLLADPKLQARLGRTQCSTTELLPLLRLHGFVQDVRTFCVEVRPLDGANFKMSINAAKPTVWEAKREIEKKQGTAVAQQELFRLAESATSAAGPSAAGGVVREDDAEPELLEYATMRLSEGDVLAMVVKERMMYLSNIKGEDGERESLSFRAPSLYTWLCNAARTEPPKNRHHQDNRALAAAPASR
jgi:hypothetical protein